MCKICQTIKPPIDEKKIAKAFKLIEKEIDRGVDPEHFNEVLDKLLETGSFRDHELDAAWESEKDDNRD